MAGVAPPVMLMICWLVCGPSVKREKGIETEIPGCKIKFELSRRKKIRRKATSTSAKRTSQPKLYSFVRPSFMGALQYLGIDCVDQESVRASDWAVSSGR